MAEDAAGQVQAAVIALVRADSAVNSLMGTRFYEFTPRDVPYPYAVFSIVDINDEGTDTQNGEEILFQIAVFTDKEGAKELHQIHRAIREVLHEQESSFSLTDHHLVNLRLYYSTVMRDPDHQVTMRVARYRALTEETA